MDIMQLKLTQKIKKLDSQLNDMTKQVQHVIDKNYKDNYQIYPNYSKGVLLDSCENLTNKTINNGTMVLDSTNHSIGSNGIHITSTVNNSTSDLTISKSLNLTDMVNFMFDLFTTTSTYPVSVSVSLWSGASRFIGNSSLPTSSTTNPIVNGKNKVSIPKSAFTVSGTPEWNNITSIVIKFTSPAGYYADFTLDNIRMNDLGKRGVVFTFDDGYDNLYNLAYPILNARGMKASCGIISSFINTAGYVTDSQIKEMYNYGFDILNHSKNHADLSIADYDTIYNEIKGCSDYLYNLGITKGQDAFIYPIQYNANVKTVLSDMGYKIARGTEARINYLPITDFLNLGEYSLTNATLSNVQLYLDKIKNYGGIAIFLIHKLTDTGAGALEVPKQTLIDIADYCIANDIEVLSLTELFDSIFGA